MKREMLNMLCFKILVLITLFINVYSQADQPIVQLDDLKIEAERHSRVASTQENRASVQVEGKITAVSKALIISRTTVYKHIQKK